MTEVTALQKKYCSRAMLLSLGAAVMLILLGAETIAKGLLLGTIFSIINFVLMGQTLPLRLGITRRKSFLLSLGSVWFRYVILAIPLLCAFYIESINFFAAAAGLFLIQIIILVHHLGGLMFRLTPYH